MCVCACAIKWDNYTQCQINIDNKIGSLLAINRMDILFWTQIVRHWRTKWVTNDKMTENKNKCHKRMHKTIAAYRIGCINKSIRGNTQVQGHVSVFMNWFQLRFKWTIPSRWVSKLDCLTCNSLSYQVLWLIYDSRIISLEMWVNSI